MIPTDLTRWINASVNQHFDAAKGDTPLWIEGSEVDIKKLDAYAELRLTDPHFKESHESLHIELDVHIMCSLKFSKTKMYDLHDIVGKFQAAMIPIMVKTYNKDADPATFVGCLQLRNDVPRSVDVLPWGITGIEERLQQTSIEAFYAMDL